jgi:catechol 2,3-dioxygenase-like lactoylglutathione lyase family enzyme
MDDSASCTGETKMAIEGIFYVYAKVSDLEVAKRFYGDTLGWKLHTDEPQVAGFWFGTGYLVAGLDTAGLDNAGRDNNDASKHRQPGGMHVAVRVGDLDAEHARLAQRGVDVGPIHVRPWGERNFSFTDPDGYVWEYGQPS